MLTTTLKETHKNAIGIKISNHATANVIFSISLKLDLRQFNSHFY